MCRDSCLKRLVYPMDSRLQLADSNVSTDEHTKISNNWQVQVQGPKKWQFSAGFPSTAQQSEGQSRNSNGKLCRVP